MEWFVVSASRRHDERDVLLGAQGGRESLIVVSMSRQRDFRRSARRFAAFLQQSLEVSAAGVRSISRIDRMMDREDNRKRLVGLLQFRDEPLPLNVADLTALRAVAVEADDRHQRSVEGPEHIWLRHRAPRSITIVRADDCRLGAKIADESREAGLPGSRVHVSIV